MGAANVSAPTFSNTTPGSILEMRLVNTGSTTNPAGSTTTLGTFTKGEIPAGSGIQALVNGQLVTAQIDVKTRHADGSAETGVVTFQHDKIAAGGAVDIVLLRSDAAPAPAIDLAARMDSYSLIAKVDPVGSAPEVSIDLGAALKAAIANGTADFWQKGAEATGARVEVPMGGSMRLVADITATADGNVKASVQFANDIAMGATGGTQQFKATVVENGVTKFQHDVTEVQYQSFRAQVSTAGEDSLHLQHDIQNLIATGMIANYDLNVGIAESLLAKLGADAASAGYNAPLSTAGVTQYMPMTGGRGDIGMTTTQNTAWLISQDVRAADAALGQAEAAAAVPWRMWDAANGTWLNTDNYPKLWTDGRGGVGKPGDPNSGGLTQQSENAGWTPESAHQPDLSYVPYLMTGDRFHLENVQAQATWSVLSHWTWPRGDDNDLVVKDNQVRGAAWSLRELVEAAAISPDGSKEKAYFTASVNENLDYILQNIPAWTVSQGETHGYLPGVYGANAIPPWQQDHFATTLAASIRISDPETAGKATEILKWMENFLVGRFEHAADGFNPRDGIGYNITILKTWAESGAATVANWQSNGTGWSQSQGNYGSLALNTLAILSEVLDSTRARAAYNWLKAEAPPYTSDYDLAKDPLNLTTPDSVYEANPKTPVSTSPYTEQGDTVVLDAPVKGAVIDMLGGFDTLTLADGGNTVTVANIEKVVGGSGRDTVTVATAGKIALDLGAGYDEVHLAVGGVTATLTGVEKVVGSAGNDTVYMNVGTDTVTVDLGEGVDRLVIMGSNTTNTVVANGVEEVIGSQVRDVVRLTGGSYVDLGEGIDRLELSQNTTNKVTVLNTEAILGGAKADQVTLGNEAHGYSIDLGNGIDSLFLWDGGQNSVLVSNVENITGYSGDDNVTIRTATKGMAIDLGGGYDVLTLSDLGSTVKATNIEEIWGGKGADGITVTGSVGAKIFAGAGNDVIVGGDGDDYIVGGLGKDVMTGGAGADQFVFNTIADSDLNARDIITDFQVGIDQLVFNNLLHGSFSLVKEASFTAFKADGNSQAHFIDSTDQLLIDSNGDGKMDMRMTLTGVDNHLSASDFVWN